MAKKSNLDVWNAVCETPDSAKKKIEGGRLKGFTDISPQYRYKKMTEIYGPVGVGWRFQHTDIKEMPIGDEIVIRLSLEIQTREGDHEDGTPIWSAPIPGVGGSKLLCMEKNGLYLNDEAWASAETDALGKAMKKLGVCSDVYESGYSKYDRASEPQAQQPRSTTATSKPTSTSRPRSSGKDPMADLEVGKIANGKASISEHKIVWEKEDGSSKKMAITTTNGAELYTFKESIQKDVADIGPGVECHIEVKPSVYRDKRQYELLKIVEVSSPQQEMFDDEGESAGDEDENMAMVGGQKTETPF